MTYSKQQVKTWVNILQLVGCSILDVGGPAVSNGWIVNKVFLALQQHTDIKTAIVQLTTLDKLDVDVDQERINQLVMTDPLRNFIIDCDFQVKSQEQIIGPGVWPSSSSDHHESKKQWRKWLFSPELEKENLYCKLVLLNHYCQQHQIKLYVYQGYEISWSPLQILNLQNIIENTNACWYSEYINSPYYQQHNHQNSNLEPCIGYQVELACIVSKHLPEPVQNKLVKFKSSNDRN
jgi:hypothetical protein